MSSQFSVVSTPLNGLQIVNRRTFEDDRGFLSRIFCADSLNTAGWAYPVSQINHSHTLQAGTVRGLHFQYPPYTDAKLVTCVNGQVFDVVVDLRPNSPTFLKSHSEVLSKSNKKSLLIPEGFAHGFQALQNNSELIYIHSCAYNPKFEAGLNPKDEKLNIDWPLPISNLSLRDASHPFITKNFSGVLT